MLVPAFSDIFQVIPPENERIKRNGIDYNKMWWIDPKRKDVAYTPESKEINKDMGAIPAEIIRMKDRVRGKHPLDSFAAIGPYAQEIIKDQKPMDVYAPLRELALFNGFILLMGVGLNRMTAIHLAEQTAGRKMFIRWANGPDKKIIQAEIGGCSEGFEKLTGVLSVIEKKVKVGGSLWRVFSMTAFLKRAAAAIQLKPEITHCDKADCVRCNDMISGGPVI
jgi:aminoglycoside 3-N-acetyltransferase